MTAAPKQHNGTSTDPRNPRPSRRQSDGFSNVHAIYECRRDQRLKQRLQRLERERERLKQQLKEERTRRRKLERELARWADAETEAEGEARIDHELCEPDSTRWEPEAEPESPKSEAEMAYDHACRKRTHADLIDAIGGRRTGISPGILELCKKAPIGAPLILNQLVYWFDNNQEGKRRAGIQRAGEYWVAKSHGEWAEELHITPDQARYGLAWLKKERLVYTQQWIRKFDGKKTTHVAIETDLICQLLEGPDAGKAAFQWKRPKANRKIRKK